MIAPTTLRLRSGPAGARPLALLLLLGILTTGCSTFSSSRRMDMNTFGENTVQMVGELQKFARPAPWVYLKKYQGYPAVQSVLPDVVAMRRLMRGIAFYSLQLVALNESRLSETAKNRELARYLRETVVPSLPGDEQGVRVNKEELEAVTREVEGSETFMAGINAAQPLASSVLSQGLLIFDRFDDRVAEAVQSIGAEVEKEFAPMKQNIVELEDLQERTMQGMTLLYKHRLGDAAALPALQGLYPPGGGHPLLGKSPTPKELEAAELELMAQLDRIRRLKDQLLPEFNIYKECQRELEGLRIQNEERARIGRATLVLWARSHKNLGVGVTVPPVIDVAGLLRAASGAAASSAGKLVPGL